MLTFLMAELPELSFGSAAPLSIDEFEGMLEQAMLPERQRDALSAFGSLKDAVAGDPDGCPRLVARFFRLERYVRATVAVKRAERLGCEFVPPSDEYEHDVVKLVDSLAGVADPLERERRLDAFRWNAIEDMSQGHVFDFDALCAYKLKLLLLVSRSRRDRQSGTEIFKGQVSAATARHARKGE